MSLAVEGHHGNSILTLAFMANLWVRHFTTVLQDAIIREKEVKGSSGSLEIPGELTIFILKKG